MKSLNVCRQIATMQAPTRQQQEFIDDDSKHRILNGCAGSRKTSTLIQASKRSIDDGTNVIMLTKIGSVTREILSRVIHAYDFEFEKRAGHYQSHSGNGVLSIANFDAFVDCQLRNNSIRNDGEAYKMKVRLLTDHANETTELVMKTGEVIDEIVIDEVQDLTAVQMRMIVDLVKHHEDVRLTVGGDVMQTLFVESLDERDEYAITYLRELRPSKHYLTVNFRCPKSHVDFANITMHNSYDAQNVPLMQACNDDVENRPVVFQHPTTQSEVSRFWIARHLTRIVKHVLTNDPEITPGDIAVLMNKTNANAVFEQSLAELNHFYMDFYEGSEPYEFVCHMKTKNNEGRTSLNWLLAENKTAFSSVHAVKGLAFKCVIILGMAEKSIPLAEWLFKPQELVGQSTFNVAVTRSTKYLFVGVNTIPSRYFMHNLEELIERRAAYLSWDNSTLESAPEFYRSLLVDYKHTEEVKFIDRYAVKPVDTPTRSVLAVKQDIVYEAHISEHVANSFAVVDALEKSTFGSRINLKLSGEERGIFGNMAELILQHHVAMARDDPKIDNDVLRHYQDKTVKFKYTSNQRILALVHELDMNKFISKPEHWFSLKIAFMKRCQSKPIREWILPYNKPTYIVDEAFKNTVIRETIQKYFKHDILSSKEWWNLAVFLTSVSGDHRVLSASQMINVFDHDISVIHANSKIYYECHMVAKISKDTKIEFQTDLLVKKKIQLDVALADKLKDVGFGVDSDTYTYGFHGISDCVLKNGDENHLIEVKAISESSPSKLKQWVFQVLCYVYLFQKLAGITITHVDIVNLYSGRLWSTEIRLIRIKYRTMIESIFKQNYFPKELIEWFLNSP